MRKSCRLAQQGAEGGLHGLCRGAKRPAVHQGLGGGGGVALRWGAKHRREFNSAVHICRVLQSHVLGSEMVWPMFYGEMLPIQQLSFTLGN